MWHLFSSRERKVTLFQTSTVKNPWKSGNTLPSLYSNVNDSNFDDAKGNMKLVYLAFCRGEGGSSQVPIIGVSCLQYKKTFSSQQHLLINQLGVSVILNNLKMGFAMILASFSDNLIRRYKQRDFEWSVCITEVLIVMWHVKLDVNRFMQKQPFLKKRQILFQILIISERFDIECLDKKLEDCGI